MPQAVTRTAPSTTTPVWGQLLRVTFVEQDLPQEQLHLALTNDGDSRWVVCLQNCADPACLNLQTCSLWCRLMLKAVLPVGHMAPGVHYNMALAVRHS